MLRFFSLILILAGGAALAYGGYQYMQTQPQMEASSAPAPSGSIGFDAGTEPVARSAMPRSLSYPPDMDEMFDVASAGTDDFMSSLRTVPVAHETPKQAMFGRSFAVTLSLDATGDDSAVESLPGNGNIVEGEAQISTTVQALVSGEAFDVEAITPATQRISPLTENVWRWKVTPTAVGNQELVIELFALMGDEALPLRTFRDSVEVEVSRIGQAIAIAQSISPITVVAGGIGSMLAGLFGFVGFFRRK
ncbi:MAG: hypothetical protein NXH72_15880 [Hyphomonadaceae bacterium]|nr:hypothetical protein [Hyphomonadaceae bacterium]